MVLGSRKSGKEEYVFLNGHVMRSDEAIRIDLGDTTSPSAKATLVPGQKEAAAQVGAVQAGAAQAGAGDLASQARAAQEAKAKAKSKKAGTARAKASGAGAAASATGGAKAGTAGAAGASDAADAAGAAGATPKTSKFGESLRRGFKGMEESDAFELTDEAATKGISFELSEHLRQSDRKATRTKYAIVGGVLLLLVLVSLCMSVTKIGTFHSPLELLSSIGTWFHLTFVGITQPAQWQSEHRDVLINMPYYSDCMLQVWVVLKYVFCGALLALSGMLYQNTFRNPIAAPSILGISNGINIALLVLVLQYGYTALQYPELYYLYSFISGFAVLFIVMLGGKAISGKGNFNTVNLILMGTIISQLLGVIITFVQAYYMDETAWEAYEVLTAAGGNITVWSYVTVLLGGLIALIPIVLYRFKLNLISFSDEESRLLGVNPTTMRVIALGCGSLMLLIAQLNLGQVAMASLVIPFVVRAVFGSEFRKQLAGNLLIGALLMLACGDLGTLISFEGYPVGAGVIVSVAAIPLFVWMLAIQQRSWE